METLDDVERDVSAVFGFNEAERPQARAHTYLYENQVRRGYNDTAMECAALDMARRAYEAGRRGAAGINIGALSSLAEELEAAAASIREVAEDAEG